jgi:hypothetical protein
MTCGLAALGITAATWIGALRDHSNAEGALAAPEGPSWHSGESANAKTITINVTTFGRLCSVIGGATTREDASWRNGRAHGRVAAAR